MNLTNLTLQVDGPSSLWLVHNSSEPENENFSQLTYNFKLLVVLLCDYLSSYVLGHSYYLLVLFLLYNIINLGYLLTKSQIDHYNHSDPHFGFYDPI